MLDLEILQNESLSKYTTIGIGGPAAQFVEVETSAELWDALLHANAVGLPLLVLGGGSNMLVCDAGWPGLVVKIGIRGISQEDTKAGLRRIVSGAGESWDDLVAYCVAENLQGIECLSGIPGTVGASPIQNIGAYGQEVKETIAWVEALDRTSGEMSNFTADECDFAYRWSRFKGADKDRYIVTRVAFDLKPGAPSAVRYGDLTKYFDHQGISNPTLADVRAAVLEVRGSKGMVVDPLVPDSRSCGSFFMNPIVTVDEARRIKNILMQDADGTEVRMPEFPAGENRVKLSAAWLMEQSGVKKGLEYCGVGVSTRHVLALINRGNGTAAELLELVRHVQEMVADKFGVALHPEPVFVGFEQLHGNAEEGLTTR